MNPAWRPAAAALLLGLPLPVAADPTPPVAAEAVRFAPPLGAPLTWSVTTRRLGRKGAMIAFSSVYALEWTRLGRGYRLDATLQRIESDAPPELVRALTAVLQPLVGERVAYLVSPDGRTVDLADPKALSDRVIDRTEAFAAESGRPEAKAIAAMLGAMSPDERAVLASADIRALVAPANGALAAPAGPNDPVGTVATVETADIGGAPVETRTRWQIDAASGLVLREQRQSWTIGPDKRPQTLVEERVRALTSH